MTNATISNDQLTATISVKGAELISLQSRSGRELIWQAGKQWARHAPVLFPMVGRLVNDQLIHQATAYPLTQHGFARDALFELVTQNADKLVYTLSDSLESLKRFPFRFELSISYHLIENQLITEYAVRNPDNKTLLFSIGAHPAFQWPLNQSLKKTDYFIRFEKTESTDIRRLHEGLVRTEVANIPLKNTQLPLDEVLFADDAIIFDQLNSRSIQYENTKNAEVIKLDFEGFPQLGIWSKPGANFICLEPWQGYASPCNFTGEWADKPGIVSLSPGAEKKWRFVVSINNID